VSDIDTAVVDSLTCLTPDGRLEKQTLRRRIELVTSCGRLRNCIVAEISDSKKSKLGQSITSLP
jgi:hypothetical protein